MKARAAAISNIRIAGLPLGAHHARYKIAESFPVGGFNQATGALYDFDLPL